MKILLRTQLGMFFLYGVISMMAISYVISYKCKEAEVKATAAVLIELSPRGLSEVKI
jgi:hypothetical protein